MSLPNHRISPFADHKQLQKRYLHTIMTVPLLLIALRLWLTLIGGFLIIADPIQTADALVPVAGDRSRVIHGSVMFQQGYARWFVVTDMWINAASPPLIYAHSVIRQAEDHGVPAARILVAPGMPKTTYAEALEMRQLARAQG